jgi:hypothetical protein
MSAVEVFLAASTEYDTARSEVRRLSEFITGVGKALDTPLLIVAEAGKLKFTRHKESDPTLSAANWPTADQIIAAITRLLKADAELKKAYAAVPAEHKKHLHMPASL